MRFRLFACFLFVLILGLFISGCSDSPESTTEPVATAQETSADSPETVEPSIPEVAPTEPEIATDREVVAFVTGDPAYRDEFESMKNSLLNQYAQTYAQFGMDISMLLAGADGRLFELGVEAEALQQIVQLILTQQEATKRGIVISDEEVQQEFDSQYDEFLIAQAWTEEELALYLAQQGKTVEIFKNEALSYVRNQMLAMAVQQAVAGSLDITDEQVSQYFIENEANYAIEEQVRASHVLVDTEQEAEEILAELNGCPSSAAGGDLEWFGRGAMVAPFDEAVFALTVGDISGIVGTEFGYHIILLTDRQDASDPELADVADQVRTDLENELSYERALEWYEGVYNLVELDIQSPMLDAITQQTDDLDVAIVILEQAQTDGTSDDPYLPFVLATFYERKMNDALAEKTAALDAEEGTENADEIAAIEARINEYRTKALDALRLAQETVGEDTGEAPTNSSEEQAP